MDAFYFRCRKCRVSLCSSECLVTPKGDRYQTDYYDEDCHDSLWFLNPDNHPLWVGIAIREGNYTKGKLKCPKCDAKLGAFDYVSSYKCSCGLHKTGSIWLVKGKVDLTRTYSLPPSRRPSPQITEKLKRHCRHSSLGSINTSEITLENTPINNGGSVSHSFSKSRSRPMPIPANIRIEMEDSDSDSLSNSPYSAVVGFFDSVYEGHTRLNDDIESGETLSHDSGSNDIDKGELHSEPYSDSIENMESVGSDVMEANNPNTGTMYTDEIEAGSSGAASQDDEDKGRGFPAGEIKDVDQQYTQGQEDNEKEEQNVVEHNKFEILYPQEEQLEDCGKIPDVRGMPDELADVYTCSICLELYYLPHTCQPCKHVFCSPCLRRLNRSMHHSLTKCPLCRKVISVCLPDDDMHALVKGMFPEEFKKRRCQERKGHEKLPPLPENRPCLAPRRVRHPPRSQLQGSFVLAHWAGVCFVVMMMILGVCILATTIAFCAWYLWEISVDVIIDVAVAVNGLFDKLWNMGAGFLLRVNVTPERAKLLIGTFGQLLHAIGHFFNRSHSLMHGREASESSAGQFLSDALQADIANYLLLCGLFTYVIYRFAKYCQTRREEVRLREAI